VGISDGTSGNVTAAATAGARRTVEPVQGLTSSASFGGSLPLTALSFLSSSLTGSPATGFLASFSTAISSRTACDWHFCAGPTDATVQTTPRSSQASSHQMASAAGSAATSVWRWRPTRFAALFFLKRSRCRHFGGTSWRGRPCQQYRLPTRIKIFRREGIVPAFPKCFCRFFRRLSID